MIIRAMKIINMSFYYEIAWEYVFSYRKNSILPFHGYSNTKMSVIAGIVLMSLCYH